MTDFYIIDEYSSEQLVLISSPSQVEVESVPTYDGCWGCKENQPNQMAHMDPGGCLYDSDWEGF